MATRLSDLKAKRQETAAREEEAGGKKKGKGKKGADDDDLENQTSPSGDASKQFDQVKASIKTIQANTKQMSKLNEKALFSPDDQKEIMLDIEKLVESSKGEAMKCKDLIKRLDKETRELEKNTPGSTSATMRRNMLDSHQKQLADAVREYQEAGDAIKNGMKDKIKRQVRLVDGNISDKQIEQAINSADPSQILKEAMGVSDVALDAVAELEERHERMRAIEQGVREVLELFQDLALMIDEQQEHMDHIQSNVSTAKNRATEGEKNLVKAQESQKRSRKVIVLKPIFISDLFPSANALDCCLE
jgi:syntaxin 1B/2/3